MPHDPSAFPAISPGRGTAVSGRPRTIAAPLLLLSVPTLLLLGFSLHPPLNHDVAALLQYAERWLAGERLYVDLVDINPPLVFLLNAIPAAIAASVPIGAIVALQVVIVVYAIWSLHLCWRIARDAVTAGSPRFWVLSVLLPFIALGFPAEMFGQREHLMIIGAMPYLLMAERRAVGRAAPRSLDVTVAALAALMFALKPYFLLLPMLVEAQLLLVLGPRRYVASVTPWVFGAVLAGYAAVTVLFFSAYLTLVVPFAVGVYQGLDFSLAGAAFGIYGFAPLLGLVALAPFAFRRDASALARLVALAALGGWAAGVIQGKGWPYHMLPGEAFVLLLAAVLAGDLASRVLPADATRRSGPMLAWLALALGLVAVTASREPFIDRIEYRRGEIASLASLFHREAAGRPVLVLSAALAPYFPALNYAGSPMGSRFMTMWMVQGNYTKCLASGRLYNRMQDMSRSERYVFRAVTADLVDHRPKLIVVDSLTGIMPCRGRSFDFLAYFMRNPGFAAAFAGYESIASPVARLRVFRLRE